ncbi:hypothetical protein [Nocardia aurea]|uniref:hypothetical protein n=1 Tax=Nocardia aurea TaxID=2144174 RepID=UPI0033A108B8
MATDSPSGTATGAIEDVIDEATDKLDEAAAEWEIHQLLVECGARGPEWELVVDRIARYAKAVLDAWLRTGAIYGELGKCRIHVEASERQRFRLAFNEDLREEILATTIVSALEALQKDIRQGIGWGLLISTHSTNSTTTPSATPASAPTRPTLSVTRI